VRWEELLKRKVIITCAVTGSADTPKKNRAVPVTPSEIAKSAIDAARAGAAVVHVHVRDPETGLASMEFEHYERTVGYIRESNTDVVINLTTGPGGRLKPSDDNPQKPAPGTTLTTPEVRTRHLVALRPELCSLDMGSMNSGGVREDSVMINTPVHIRAMAKIIKEIGVKPELEVFDTGHIRHACHMIEAGEIDSPPLFQLCMGIEWGAAATPAAMGYMLSLLPASSHWAAFGISRDHFRLVAQSSIFGGHVRVGLEDTLHVENGVLARSNAELVEKAIKILQLLDFDVATAAEARQILGLT
jgi:uncharacterized protein (DUF849 family)